MKDSKLEKTRLIAYIIMGVLTISCIAVVIMWKTGDKTTKKTSFDMAKATLAFDAEGAAIDEPSDMGNTESDQTDDGDTDNAVGADDSILGKLLKRDSDAEYFTPITDDYMYVLIGQETGMGLNQGYSQDYEHSVLYSFDEYGNVVQYMKRDINTYYEDNPSEGSPGYSAGEEVPDYVHVVNGVEYTDGLEEGYEPDGIEFLTPKGEVIWSEASYKRNHLGYYISKPEDSNVSDYSKGDFGISPEDVSILDIYSPATDDYIVGRKKQSSTDFDDYYREELTSFDEEGNCVQYRFIYTFENNDDALKFYNKYLVVFPFDENGIEKPTGNILVINQMLNDKGEKISFEDGQKLKDRRYIENEDEYWTKPYLTSKQFWAMYDRSNN